MPSSSTLGQPLSLVRLTSSLPYSTNRLFLPAYRTLASSSSSPSTSSSSSSPSPKSSTSSRSKLALRRGADLVGPPDPISNLRPVKYGSAFQPSSSIPSSPTSVSSPSSHPYSLSEFKPTSFQDGGWNPRRRAKGSKPRMIPTRSHSDYYQRLLERLEEAELVYRLRMTRSDSFSQNFWSDNNKRFNSALEDFTESYNHQSYNRHVSISTSVEGREEQEKGQEVGKVTSTTSSQGSSAKGKEAEGKGLGDGEVSNTVGEKGEGPPSIKTPRTVRSELDLDSDSLAGFYSTWLQNNAKSHRDYNNRLWYQTFNDLHPAARYQRLRVWANLVRRFENALGWGI
ncbi:hypothetical protein IE53DRAFT_391274 [Violaceomyces palustris]|uniref:Uncharacterized protein n=1 Tax=Violaceomyces palustris TaxID=1673888 RepID=A0ACD0NL55_9BASI|nr:hypothetical protein IE53DRAFT_391274 [Violaceomyces palustris]